MIRKILVAYDNGNKSKKALEFAVDIAKSCGAEITLFTSVKMPDYIKSFANHEWQEKLEEQSQDYFRNALNEAAENVKKQGLDVKMVILRENPGESIVRFAEKEKIDLIIIGCHNRSSIERFLLGLGSVSNYVINHANCPVLVVKE